EVEADASLAGLSPGGGAASRPPGLTETPIQGSKEVLGWLARWGGLPATGSRTPLVSADPPEGPRDDQEANRSVRGMKIRAQHVAEPLGEEIGIHDVQAPAHSLAEPRQA